MDPYGRPYGGVAYNSDPILLVKAPTEYRYLKVLRIFLRIVSGWPTRGLGEKALPMEDLPYAYYNTCLSILFFIMQFWYLFENSAVLSFFELGHMYIALLLNVVSTSRGLCLCVSKRYRTFAVKFLTSLHVFYHKDKSDYSRKVFLKVHKICSYFTLYLITNMMSAVTVFNIVPTVVNYKTGKYNGFNDPVNVTFELAIYFKFPSIDPERSFKAFVFSFFLNWYASYLCASSIIMFDLFLSIMVFNLWGHFKILLYDLNMFPKPAAATDGNLSGLMKDAVMFSETEQVNIAIKLKESILYHKFIIDFTNEMSNCFGFVLFVYYSFYQVSGCLLLLECSQGNSDALALYVPLAIMMFTELIQISIIFETIGSMSEKLRDSVYCLPWEYMNTKNRKTVMIFLINVQEPVHVKAGGLVDVGVTTMAGILKTSFSYFAFLRTMSE